MISFLKNAALHYSTTIFRNIKAETYLETSRKSAMEPFAKMVNSYLEKSFIKDVLLGFKYGTAGIKKENCE